MAFDIKSWERFKVTGVRDDGISGTFDGKKVSMFDKNADLIPMDAMNQFLDCMEQPEIQQGALMPDAHVGYALPIGGVVLSTNHLCPAYVGYDIGCGVTSMATTYDWQDVAGCAGGILSCMYGEIPTGFNHHEEPQEWSAWEHLAKTDFLKKEFGDRGLYQMGTMGGNNHFIEIGRSTVEDKVWITVHSGSRNIGHKVATHYMRLASGDGKVREGHHFLEIKSQEGMHYLRDMQFCVRMAYANRLALIAKTAEMIDYFLDDGDLDPQISVNCSHNFAEYSHNAGGWIHRKGATPAVIMQYAAIPANRAEGVFIVTGKGNADSILSCSHGAGRVDSRKWAKKNLDSDQAKVDMRKVMAITHPGLIDEAPRAYKPISKVMESQGSLLKIREMIRPLINFKDLRKITVEEAFTDAEGYFDE
jgi:tRNA-splicing ligase RtcB